MAKSRKRSHVPWRPTTRGGEPSLVASLDATTTWRLTNRAQIWNVHVPRGTLVRYFPEAGVPMKFVDTQIESEAWPMGNELVVCIVGVAGAVNCDHLQLRTSMGGAELFGTKETP